mmetsp:Transcript_107584/g.213719  ORF Transcript_107584/g.213719 Transcript_107584/m.213719 type:complete len:211 (+) Transcript_107584:364-996(+)
MKASCPPSAAVLEVVTWPVEPALMAHSLVAAQLLDHGLWMARCQRRLLRELTSWHRCQAQCQKLAGPAWWMLDSCFVVTGLLRRQMFHLPQQVPGTCQPAPEYSPASAAPPAPPGGPAWQCLRSHHQAFDAPPQHHSSEHSRPHILNHHRHHGPGGRQAFAPRLELAHRAVHMSLPAVLSFHGRARARPQPCWRPPPGWCLRTMRRRRPA